MLTIGEAATYAGVTVRAIRHYHACGLLPEPPRDGSGYRRYDGAALVELVRIKTLADAGIPLARIQELLAGDAILFRASLDELDDRLEARICELRQTQSRLRQLKETPSLFVPPEVAAWLEQLGRLGLREELITAEKNAWILTNLLYPERVPRWIATKQRQLKSPEYVLIYRELDSLYERSPDDPALPEIARRLVRLVKRAASDPCDAVAVPSVHEARGALLANFNYYRSAAVARVVKFVDASLADDTP